jgi:hypothetical protein
MEYAHRIVQALCLARFSPSLSPAAGPRRHTGIIWSIAGQRRASQQEQPAAGSSPANKICIKAAVLLLDRRARLLSPATAEVAAGIAKQRRPDIRIGISAKNDSAGLTAGGPTDNISFRRIARHDRYARRRVRVSLIGIRALRALPDLPRIGR